MKPMFCRLFIPTPTVERETTLLERELASHSRSLLCQAVEIAVSRAISGEYDYLKALRISAGQFLKERLKEALCGHWWESVESEVKGEYEESVVDVVVGLGEIPVNYDDLSNLYANFKSFLDEYEYLIRLACINITLECRKSTFTDREFVEMLEDALAQEAQEDREKILKEWLKPTVSKSTTSE